MPVAAGHQDHTDEVPEEDCFESQFFVLVVNDSDGMVGESVEEIFEAGRETIFTDEKVVNIQNQKSDFEFHRETVPILIAIRIYKSPQNSSRVRSCHEPVMPIARDIATTSRKL